MAIASASLAQVCKERRQFKRADRLLQSALEHEPNLDDRVLLRRDQIELAVAAKWESKLKSLYAKFMKEVQRHPDKSDLSIDLHMLLGDAAWSIPRDRDKALEAYAAGIAYAAMGLNVQAIGSVLAHVVDKLLSPDVPQLAESQRRERLIEAWINRQPALKKVPALISIVTGPFKVVRRISSDGISRRQLTGQKMQCLYEEEVFKKAG